MRWWLGLGWGTGDRDGRVQELFRRQSEQDLVKDWLRVKDTSWVSDRSKRVHCGSLTEMAQSGVQGGLDVHLLI